MTLCARARSTATFPRSAPSPFQLPGALDGWWTLHQRYGKLKWAELFEPAIHYCEAGDATPQIIGYYIKRNMAAFLRPNSGIEETANAVAHIHAQRRCAQ